MEKVNKKVENEKDKENKTDKNEPQKLSEEDEEYKKNTDDMITAFLEPDFDIKKNAYHMIKQEITNSTGSMTSIPRPLKFFRSHYEKIKEAYDKEKENGVNLEVRRLYGDLLCILVLVKETQETSLKYVLENDIAFAEWGQELVRSLSGEITTEYLKRLDEGKPFDDLIKLIGTVVTTLIASNNESEAIDLLIELDLVDELKTYCNEKNYKKFCTYLLAISNYSAELTEQKRILDIIYELYTKFNQFTDALIIAIKLKERLYIHSTITNCKDRSTKIQMAFILARSKYFLESSDLDSDILEIIKNLKASDLFKKLGRAMDIVEPKHPEEIIKSHLEDKKDGIQLESYKVNMTTSIVSGFINAGFCTETLLSKKDSNNTDWLSKNKEEGLVCALAGLGLVNIWNIESGANELEKFMDENEMNPYKRGGYNIGLGIISSGVLDENNTAMALLSDQTQDKK